MKTPEAAILPPCANGCTGIPWKTTVPRITRGEWKFSLPNGTGSRRRQVSRRCSFGRIWFVVVKVRGKRRTARENLARLERLEAVLKAEEVVA